VENLPRLTHLDLKGTPISQDVARVLRESRIKLNILNLGLAFLLPAWCVCMCAFTWPFVVLGHFLLYPLLNKRSILGKCPRLHHLDFSRFSVSHLSVAAAPQLTSMVLDVTCLCTLNLSICRVNIPRYFVSMARYGMVWYGMVMVRYGMEWHGWSGMVWYSAVKRRVNATSASGIPIMKVIVNMIRR
jgi:hypothetical protein